MGVKTRRPQVFICYDLVERLIDEEKDLIFKIEPELFSIGTITLSEEMVSLLNVGVSEIKSTKESNLEQRTLNQTIAEMVPSTMKSKDIYVRLEVSLENKVYPKTYYHHSWDDIQVDETPVKI